MDPVVVEPGAEGLGEMLAALVRGNLERDPRRMDLLSPPITRANIRAADAGAAVGILFGAGCFRVLPSALPAAELEIASTRRR